MLLSFAQFEREVTGERIRDKIAASKKKGMWMGGLPPIGYDVKDRSLVVNQAEAETVRHIYRRYAALTSVRLLKEELNQDGVVSKLRTDRCGRATGGKPLARGALYRMLQNRIYRGEIVHKDKSYPGQHEAILDEPLWDRVQGILASNRVDRVTGAYAKQPSLLAGFLFDDAGERMTPSHANKNGKRYRYYVSQSLTKGRREHAPNALRVPAGEVEQLIADRLQTFLRDKGQLHAVLEHHTTDARDQERMVARACELADGWVSLAPAEKRRLLRLLVVRIVMKRDELELTIYPARLPRVFGGADGCHGPDEHPREDDPTLVLTIPARLKRAGLEIKLVVEGDTGTKGEPDRGLLRIVALAHRYNQLFARGGRSIYEMAHEAGVSRSYFTRVLRLSFLSPEITRAILQGRQPREMTAIKLMANTRIPITWEDQRTALHFD